MKIWFPLIKVDTGSDVYTMRLADSLRQHGIDTEVTCFPRYYELQPGLLKTRPPPRGTDIIHGNSWTGYAFKRRGIPLVTTVHLPVMDPAYDSYKSFAQKTYHLLLIRGFERHSLSAADGVVAVSDYVNKYIENTYTGISPGTIHNFVDTDFFSPAPARKAADRKKFRLLYVGNLSKRKGSDLLRPIMEKLGERFILTATTGLRKKGISLSGENITTTGRLEGKSLVQAYHDADALLFPTRLEGFGYSALEAMACGLPVIASNNSSIPEIVEHQKTGLLCPTDDIDAFCRACEYLYSHPQTACEYGRAGRETALTRFTRETITHRYISFYDELLKQ